MTAVLRAEGASYRIGDAQLVSDATLGLEAGRLVAIVGPNGAGKSTLVRLLSGELAPSAGRILCEDTPLAGMPPHRLACLRAVLPQSSRLAFPFTVREVVRIGLDGVGQGLDGRARNAIVADSLARADVAHLATRAYQSLSGGEAQRTQFARVLAQLAAGRSVAARQALLLDEPIASLDLRHQLALLDAAHALSRDGLAVLAVLHDLNLAAAFADDVVVMQGGRIVAAGPPGAVIRDDLVRAVFGVAIRIGEVPADGRPFLVPRRGATIP